MKAERKAFDLPEGAVQKNIGEDGEVKAKGKRGRKKRVSAEGPAGESSPAKGKKRRKSGEGGSVVLGGAGGDGIGEDDLDLDDVEDD